MKMRTYQVEAPDGKIIDVEGPEDATDQDIIKFAQSQYAATKRDEAKVSPEEQKRRDEIRAGVLRKELEEAKTPNEAAAVQRELRRMGIDVSPRAKPSEPSAADALRQQLGKVETQNLLELAKNVNLPDVAQLGASGLAARGGYLLSPALRAGVERVAEASQRPTLATPGTPPLAPQAPTVPPSAGGLIPTDPQNTRILTGTVDEGTTGRARQTGYATRDAQEVARRREVLDLERRLMAAGAITPEQSVQKVLASAPTMTSTPAGVAIPAGTVYPTQAPPKVSPLTQVAEKLSTIGRTSANLLADVLRSRAMGALGAGSAAYQGLEALKHLKAGRDEEAALSGLGALGSGLMMIPTLPTATTGALMSVSPYLYRRYKEATPEQTQRMLSNVGTMGEPAP